MKRVIALLLIATFLMSSLSIATPMQTTANGVETLPEDYVDGYDDGKNYDCEFLNESINISSGGENISIGLGSNFTICNMSDDTVFYRQHTTNIIFCYQMKKTVLKESITLNHTMNVTAEYLMSIGDMNWDYNNLTGEYRFYTKDVEFYLHRGQILDANSTTVYFDYGITWHGNNTFTLKLEINSTLLHNLTFPVTVDPTIEIFNEIYPVLSNPSFETGDLTGWITPGGNVPNPNVVYGNTPDGQYKLVPGVYGTSYTKYMMVVSSRLVMFNKNNEMQMRINRDNGNPFWSADFWSYHWGDIFYYYYDSTRSLIAAESIDLNSMNLAVGWNRYSRNFTGITDSARYMSLMFTIYSDTGWGGYPRSYASAEFDGIYLGDWHNETNFFTINPCDTQTVQSQNEYISFWAVDSYGVAFNTVQVTVENLAFKSLTVNGIGVSGNNLGYRKVGNQTYIQLGIESPATLGLYNVSVLFVYYDTYNQEIGREHFLIQVGNVAIQISLDFDAEIYQKGQTGTLRIANNMDRAIRAYIYAWYEATMFLYGDTEYSLGTGAEKVFNLSLIKEGKYTFEFRIYYEEVLEQRELRVKKNVYVVPANIHSDFATEIYGVKGNTTLDYSFFTNSTGLGSYKMYVSIIYPDSSQIIQNRTVYSGLYEWFFPIPVPPANYSEASFTIEVFRPVNTTGDIIQYGTGEYYQDGLKTWEHTYTVYEGAKVITGGGGWAGVEWGGFVGILGVAIGVLVIVSLLVFFYFKRIRGRT